tara:strand:+ start:18405 stop:19163 length:759 start_codon:yes stop_codon:yes gene_type:complete
LFLEDYDIIESEYDALVEFLKIATEAISNLELSPEEKARLLGRVFYEVGTALIPGSAAVKGGAKATKAAKLGQLLSNLAKSEKFAKWRKNLVADSKLSEVLDELSDNPVKPAKSVGAMAGPLRPGVKLKKTPVKNRAKQVDPDWGHTFVEHGNQRSIASHADRARNRPSRSNEAIRPKQNGRWIDHEKFAEWLENSDQILIGHHEYPFPDELRNFADVITPDQKSHEPTGIFIEVRRDGTIKTAYPFFEVKN